MQHVIENVNDIWMEHFSFWKFLKGKIAIESHDDKLVMHKINHRRRSMSQWLQTEWIKRTAAAVNMNDGKYSLYQVTTLCNLIFNTELLNNTTVHTWAAATKTIGAVIENIQSLFCNIVYIDDLVQYCSISITNALEILQSCTKPTIW